MTKTQQTEKENCTKIIVFTPNCCVCTSWSTVPCHKNTIIPFLFVFFFILTKFHILLAEKAAKSLRKSVSYKNHLCLSEYCTESVLPQYTVFFHYIFLMVDYSLGTVKVCWYSILFFQMQAHFRRLLRRLVALLLFLLLHVIWPAFAAVDSQHVLTVYVTIPLHTWVRRRCHTLSHAHGSLYLLTLLVSKYAAASTVSAQSF